MKQELHGRAGQVLLLAVLEPNTGMARPWEPQFPRH